MPSLFDRIGEYLNNATAPVNASRDYGATNQPTPKTPKGPEPKVYLAAERTLLNWLRVALLIGTFSVALVNSSKHSHGSPLLTKVFGLVYALIGFGTIVYAWRMFELRRKRINERYPGHFDDLVGPVVICVVLFSAVLANFIIQVIHREDLHRMPTPKNPWLSAYLNLFIQTH